MVKTPPANAGEVGDVGSIPGLGRSPGEWLSNPLLYSCLENSMDRGAWWVTVHGITKSWTQLKQLSTRVRNNWQTHSKELWGKELWFDIWEIFQTTEVSVFHVDAHSVPNSTEQWYNYYRGTNPNPSCRSWSRIQWLKRFDFVGTQKNVAIWEKKQHIGGLRIQVLP